MDSLTRFQELSNSSSAETIGKRIARLRQENGWTQQILAARLAISRVAVSHIEMDLSLPGERTITLLAGLFKMAPHELVDGSTYPPAKAERLPLTVCSYTRLEVELALLDNDFGWLGKLSQSSMRQSESARLRQELFHVWEARLEEWDQTDLDEGEALTLAAARQKLALISRMD